MPAYLVVEPVLAHVHHRLALVEQTAREDLGDNDVMIAGAATVDDAAFERRQRLAQDWPASTAALELQPSKGRLTQFKAFAEMGDHVGLALFEDVEREDGAGRQLSRDLPSVADGDR